MGLTREKLGPDSVSKKIFITEIVMLTIMYIFSVTGSSYVGVRLGGFTLSPFRLLFLVVFGITLVRHNILLIPKAAFNYIKFYFLWAIWGFISILWAKDLKRALTSEIILIISLCCMVISCQILTDSRKIHLILKAVAICFVIMTFIGLYESLTGHYFFVNDETILNRMAIEKYRAPLVFFTNQNDYSLFLVYGIFVALYARGSTEAKISRLIYDVAIAVALWLIIFAGSRGCAIAFLIGVIYRIYIILRNKERKSRVWIAFTVGSILLISVFILNMGKITAALQSFFHFGVTTASIRSDATRFRLILDGLDMIPKSLGIGVGLSNSGYYLEHVYRNTGGIWALHNWYLQIFAESGLIIGILYIFQYFSLFKRIKYIYYKTDNPQVKQQAQLFLTVIAAFLVGLLSPSSVFDMEWLWMVWAVIIAFIGQAYNNL